MEAELVITKRSSTGLALVCLWAAAGCATTARPAATASSDASDTATSELAARARHDVDQLRAMQAASPDRPARPPRTTPPEIEWLTPAARAGPAGGQPVVESPLAHLDPPPLHPTTHRNPSVVAAATPAATTAPAGAAVMAEPVEVPGGEVTDPAAVADEDERLRQLVVALSAELYRRAAYSDMPMRELLLIAATTIVTPDRALVPDALPGLTDRERELLGALQTHYAALGRTLADSGDPEALVKAIDELHKALARAPRLGLPHAALCTRVGGFGDFDEFPRNESGHYAFLAHTGQEAIVYVEVEQFTSELNDQGLWVTALSQQLVMYSDRDGIPVWREAWQDGIDTSKNKRDDFFIVQIITLPPRLSVGRYQLKIHIRDERSGAEAETAVELEMVADPRMVE